MSKGFFVFLVSAGIFLAFLLIYRLAYSEDTFFVIPVPIEKKVPSPRFKDNGNGTITDRYTDLLWIKNYWFEKKDYTTAYAFAENIGDGVLGLTDNSQPGDWRLPTLDELITLTSRENCCPALPPDNFFVWQSETDIDIRTIYMWSSSGFKDHEATYGWTVNLHSGSVRYWNKMYELYVIPVREEK